MSLPEIVLVLAVILIVFGPEKLPEAARSMGKFFAYMKKNTDDVRREFYNSVYVPAKDARSQVDSSLKGIRNARGKIVSELKQDAASFAPNPPPTDESSKKVSDE